MHAHEHCRAVAWRQFAGDNHPGARGNQQFCSLQRCRRRKAKIVECGVPETAPFPGIVAGRRPFLRVQYANLKMPQEQRILAPVELARFGAAELR